MTLNPVCENVETAQGVPLTVTGEAQVQIYFRKVFWERIFSNIFQVKIFENSDLLRTACEKF